MATFASSSLAQSACDTEDNERDDGEKKHEPKKIKAQDIGSLFTLQSELVKAKEKVARVPITSEYKGGSKGVLNVKKDEKAALKLEASKRKEKIKELSMELQREEEQRLATIERVMKEKSELYDKLAGGKVILMDKDDNPIDFMVDFLAKKRTEERKRVEPDPVPEPEPEAGPSSSSKEVLPEHYIPDEERRVYGASHVRFSQNEEKRKHQMDELMKMSEDTMNARLKNKTLQDKREELKKQKIARLRERMGLPPLKEATPPPEIDLKEIPLPADPEEKEEQQQKKRIRSDREWDRGKDRFFKWIEKERSERDDEFAPPKSYYK